MIRRQVKGIWLFVAILTVLTVALAILFNTVWKDSGQASSGAAQEYMVEPLGMDEISAIEVTNREYSWRLYRDAVGELCFEGAENVLLNQTMVAYLRTSVAYLSVSGKVEEPLQMKEYGLTDKTCRATFTVTPKEGASYTVLVGDELVGGEGYYARLSDSEDVFVLGTGLEDCLFGDLTFFLSGQVAPALTEDNYYKITDFKIVREGEPLVEIEMIPEDEKSEDDLSTHRVSYPAKYEPNTDLVTRIFKSFVSFVGEDVVAYDLIYEDDAARREEVFELLTNYGFFSEEKAEMHCEVSYTCEGEEILLYISRPDAQSGKTYVYSPDYDIIASFASENLAWAEYDLMEYTQKEIYARSIERIQSIAVKGLDIDSVFTLTHGEEAADLRVRSERDHVNVQDFRQFYTQLLYVKNEGYAEVPEDYEKTESLRLTITRVNGEKQEFVFYDIESLKSYYTIDGEGVFYVKRDYVRKLLDDAARLLVGEKVEAVTYA